MIRISVSPQGLVSELDAQIVLCHIQLHLLPPGDPSRLDTLDLLAALLFSRFSQGREMSDLDEAVALNEEALSLLPEGHADRARSLVRLAGCLHVRFTQLGSLSDLDDALALQRNALELYPQGHPARADSLGTIAVYLRARFKQLGTVPDLDEALVLERNALELYPQDHPHRVISLDNLALSLRTRFRRFGTLSDLDEALALQRNALELRPQGHPDRSGALGNLANSLMARFIQLGTLPDLHEALDLQRSSLELCPQGHPDRVVSLGNLANAHYCCYTELGSLSDLDEALALQRAALGLRPPGHPQRADSLGSIAVYLRSRFDHLGTLSDLDEALALERSALEHRPQGNPLRAISLGNIARYLFSRFELLGSLSDLDEALAFERSALELRPPGHPHRTPSLSNLARYLHARFKHSTMHDIGDLQEAFSLYSQLSDISETVFSSDLGSVKEWIRAAEGCKHSTIVLAYQTFLRLTVHHLAAVPSLPQHHAIVKQLMKSLTVDAFSACIRYGNYPNAIELLEQGRGVFWSQLNRLRSPLDDVIASSDTGKKLADKFIQISFLLRNAFDAPLNAESLHDRTCRLSIQLQDTVAEIRKLPRLSHFLQPPLFSDLQAAAAGGPVIIVNASQYTCDALVLLSDQDPVHVALRITKARASQLSLELQSLTVHARFNDMTREFVILLRELWDVVVFPVVDILQASCPRRSRIWWCPTAEFSLIPLHAAGPYRKGQLNLSDLYISSYTPTLTALIHARQKRSLDLSIEQHRFLAVGQAQAPGQDELTSVNAELSTISQRLASVAAVTHVKDQDAYIAKVGEELKRNNFVHLACHGIPDRKRPFESGFALGDGLLKIDNIMRYELHHAQFAYLSACHTTVGDEESPDEVIHLAAAMQFAGFRSVIGTMWAVDDTHAREITPRFYQHMVDESGRLDYARAALALHKTMRSFRPSEMPFDQRILYIHIGA